MSSTQTGGKGLELEEVLKAYFWQAGYFVVRGIPYRIDDEDITDIDLWLYERPAALTRRRIIVDVKNKRSPRAAERIVWAKGLQSALGADEAIVATTDKRLSVRRFSKALGITLLDGEAIAKLTQSDQLKAVSIVRSDDFDAAIKRIDEGRESTQFRRTLNVARSSLLQGLGVQSANASLQAVDFFAAEVAAAQPLSEQAQVALRALYLCAAIAAISVDYMMSDLAFRSPDERRKSIIESIRYGHSDSVDALGSIKAATELVRVFAENGAGIAKQVEQQFHKAANAIHAEVIAEYAVRAGSSDGIFNVGRELERAAFSVDLPAFDELSLEVRSWLGVVLDFSDVPRDRVARAWSARNSVSQDAKNVGPLFDRTATKR